MSAAPRLSHAWAIPSNSLDLAGDAIHIWYAALDLSPTQFDCLNNTLTIDERERARRFVFTRDRQHFIAARGILRNILSRYVHIAAHKLTFIYGKHGKPSLVDRDNPLSLQFNLSHSEDKFVCAVALNAAIGIDIERIREEINVLSFAKRFFSDKEFQALSHLTPSLQNQYFFHYWTLKEALVKALGNGLWLGLSQFEVGYSAEKEAIALLEIQGSVNKAAAWTTHFLSLDALMLKDDYVAALAIPGRPYSIQYWQWRL